MLACSTPTKKNPLGRTGTYAGFQAHRTAKEDICEACQKAARDRQYEIYHKDPDKFLKRSRERHFRNKERYNARQRAYYWANRERSISVTRMSQKTPDGLMRKRMSENKRRAKKLNGNLIPTNYGSLDDKKCACCGDRNGILHIDHIVPIHNGGSDDVRNLQWLCQPCNSSKHIGTHCRIHDRFVGALAVEELCDA